MKGHSKSAELKKKTQVSDVQSTKKIKDSGKKPLTRKKNPDDFLFNDIKSAYNLRPKLFSY
jgi:hypothetical protein